MRRRKTDLPAGCAAVSYMDNLGYNNRAVEARLRIRCLGERQTYCAICQLARWPEEQVSCPRFERSDELEAFYANEELKSRDIKLTIRHVVMLMDEARLHTVGREPHVRAKWRSVPYMLPDGSRGVWWEPALLKHRRDTFDPTMRHARKRLLRLFMQREGESV